MSKKSKKKPLNSPSLTSRPIGVFDSGVGGLTVLNQLLKNLPNERFIYFGDTARVPYGNKSPETIKRYCREIANFLLDPAQNTHRQKESIKLLVIACNTASAIAAQDLSRTLSIPVIGVVKSGAQAAAAQQRKGRIAVIATRSTIKSRVYEKHLLQLAPGLKIISQACPLLVPLVEEGWFNHSVTKSVLKHYLSPILTKKPNSLILGCTHYPMLESMIKKICGPAVTIIDSPSAAAQDVSRRLNELNLSHSQKPAGPKVSFYVSDDPKAFQKTAHLFLGRRLTGTVKKINLKDNL